LAAQVAITEAEVHVRAFEPQLVHVAPPVTKKNPGKHEVVTETTVYPATAVPATILV